LTSSRDEPVRGRSLLSPVAAGTAAERLTGDRAVLAAMVDTEAALAGVLADLGLVSADDADAVARACADLVGDDSYLDDLAVRAADCGGNPVIPLVADLRERVGDDDPAAAPAVHRGATSQDVLDTALMLVAREALRQLTSDLRAAADHAVRLCEEHRDTACCGRTLGQQAMPTTFGLRAAGWLTGFTDALRRVETVAVTLPVQLGGPVGSTAAYGEKGPAVVEALAARLGLAAPTLAWHTRRTPVADLGHALVVATGAAGKVAADVVLMSASEVRELSEDTAGGSSSMPHKANPAQSVLVSAAARQVPALVSVLGSSLTAEQERPAGAWHAEWEPLRQATRLCGAAVHRCAQVLSGLHVDVAAMQRNLDQLVTEAGLDPTVVSEARAAAMPWVDRALADYRKVIL
jgi:3-carboxy-cis,cis-muconate cycloisomerase